MATIQGIYIALFGRPADTAGLAFFNAATKNGADLGAIGNLSGQKEYTDRFVGQSSSQIINSIYQSLFNRPGEQTGIDFYVAKLASGALTINNIAIAILDGALGSDKTTVDAKIAAADLFTSHLDLAIEQNAYSGNAAAAVGRTFITAVDATHLGTAATADAAILLLLNSAGQAPGGDGSTGGGDPGTGASDISYKVNAAVTPHKEDASLLIGNGNPNKGFAVTTNSAEHIELGLSARYRYGDTQTNGVADANHVVKFAVDSQNLAIAYSVSDTDGIDLAKNTYKLIFDVDPSENNAAGSAKQFILTEKDDAFVWVLDKNFKFADDASTSTATQNIQPVNEAFNKAGTYDVQLIASDSTTNATLAESHIQIVTNITRELSSSVASTGDYLYVGKGNSADQFAIATIKDAGITLGIAGKISGGDQHDNGTLHQPSGNLFADGLVHYAVGATAQERFVYSIQSEKTLDNFVFKLKIDTDPTAGTNYIDLHLTNSPSFSAGNTSNSKFSWSNDDGSFKIQDDGGDAGGHVTQNTENFGWFDNVANDAKLQPNGHYDVILEAYAADGVTLLGSNHVVFDVGSLEA